MIDLFQTGAYLRCPGGNVENISDQKQVIKWAALNIGNDPCVNRDPRVWDRQRMLYQQGNIPCFPWLHCRNLADINFLVATANAWVAPAIGLNIEDVVDDVLHLDIVGPYVRSRWAGPVHMATLAWVQNSQDWSQMDYTVAALEIFPDESAAAKKPQDCADHAFAEGLKNVTFLYKTKNHSPSDYDMTICHSLYTADDIPPTADQWKIWAADTPCTKLEDKETMSFTPNQKKEFRQQLTRFALVAEKYEARWHYSQARPFTGLGAPFSSTHHDDCSAYVALLYYAAAREIGKGIHDPLDEHFSGWGNTDSCYSYIKAHSAPKDKYRVGDIALFLEREPEHHHVITCRKAGTKATALWTSFGQESGPQKEMLGYRNDLTGVFRHPSLL